MKTSSARRTPFPGRIHLIAILVAALLPLQAMAGLVLSGGGLTLAEEGGAIAPGNLAASGTAFAKDLLPGFSAHSIPNINDQQFGNGESWIGNSSGTFAGISLGATPVTISSFAFGRDNDGVFTDRTLGLYTLQYTTVPNPNATTSTWTTIGTLDYQSPGGTNFTFPSKRHRYFFNAVAATGIRLIMPSAGNCVDELEVYPGIVVNTTADEIDTPAGANISLREAVRDCPAGAAIGFASALNGQTITLTTGSDISIGKTLTIDASSLTSGLTIDGGAGTNRIFTISAGTVSLKGLSLTGGGGNGAIVNNYGGAIFANTGSSVSLSRCALFGNSAGYAGGAIFAINTALSLEFCTVSGNFVNQFIGIQGGGISSNSTVTLTHCTISGNTAPLYGGGLDTNTAPILLGNIIVGNSALSGPDIYNITSFTPTAKNYIGSTSGSGMTAGPTVLTPVSAGAIELSSLGNHGGPTWTMRLLPGSPARNSATVLVPAITADQRGFPIVATPDLGAFETQIGAIANQTVNEDSGTGAIAFTVGTVGTLSATSSNTAVIANAGIALGGSGANRTVSVTPVANASGTATININDALSGETQTFNITVTPVNDPPVFTKGADQSVPQNSGARTVAGWATGFVAGPPDESGQTVLGYQVTNDNNALFSAQPAIATDGTLTFTPATNATGLATVTVRVQDSGGILNTGIDLSAPQTFAIAVNPIVTTAADSGAGSLRAALTGAASIPGANTITFDPTLSGQTVALLSEIVVNDTAGVTLDASSLTAGITFSGSASRFFTVGSGASLSLTGITLTGGTGTGAAFSGAGGAIFNLGTLTLTRCTLHGNSSANTGGAISSGSFGGTVTVTLTNCTLTTNTSADGGAIFNGTGSTVSLRHCTIVGNNASGAGTGGVKANGMVTFTASIIAGNAGGSGVENLGGASWSGTNSITSGDPLVGPLADNGGPTKTMALLAGSPALDVNNIPVAGVDTDQRGLPRIREGDGTGSIHSDAGALEMQTPPAAGDEQFIVTTTADENNATGTLGTGVSLREAIRVAAPGRTVGFAPALSGQTITLTLGAEIFLSKSVTIDAMSLPAELTIDGGPGSNRILYVDSGQTVSLRGLRFTGGNAQGAVDSNGGGAISSDGQLSVDSCMFSSNGASAGGAIICRGTTTINACTFTSNNSASKGSALYIQGSATVTKSTFQDNSTGGEGGAIYVSISVSASFENCTIVQNRGRGIASFGTVTIENCILALNTPIDLNGTISYVGANITSGDPLLAPLANYGGRTRTMALLPGSPARNAAVGSTATSDQRGFPIVGTPDIGAYEAGTFTDFDAWAWENIPSADPALHAPGHDYDGDGHELLTEYALLFSATASDAVVPLACTRNPSGTIATLGFPVRFDATDLTYRIERSTNLTSGWTNVFTYQSATATATPSPGITAVNGSSSIQLTDTTISGEPALFYRLRIERP